MALDFPASPVVGQVYNGYTWTGVAWEAGYTPVVPNLQLATYASAAARDAAITSPQVGMQVLTTDDKVVWLYTGSAWRAWGKEPTAYTPTLSGATRTSGDLYYSISNGVMKITGQMIVSAVVGPARFTIPSGFTFNTNVFVSGAVWAGVAGLTDVGTANYSGGIRRYLTTNNELEIQALNAAGTYGIYSQLTSTVPHTWGAGDIISINCSVELA